MKKRPWRGVPMLLLAGASGCGKDGTSVPVERVAVPAASTAAVAPSAVPSGRSAFPHTAWAEGLPPLRSACASGAADAGERRMIVCRDGKVASVAFGYLDAGPELAPDAYLARFDGPRLAAPPGAAPRVHVLPNAELLVAFTRPTRRLTGNAVHVALDLEPEANLEALAKRLGLAPVEPIRDPAAWMRSLSAQRGPGLGLGAVVSSLAGGGVRLTLVNRGDSELTVSAAGLAAPSTALEVWANGTLVHPGPPPMPPAAPPMLTLAPGATKGFDYRLSAYAGNLHGAVTVAPKRQGEDAFGAVETLRLTVP